jgi:hypothetical protein
MPKLAAQKANVAMVNAVTSEDAYPVAADIPIAPMVKHVAKADVAHP